MHPACAALRYDNTGIRALFEASCILIRMRRYRTPVPCNILDAEFFYKDGLLKICYYRFLPNIIYYRVKGIFVSLARRNLHGLQRRN